MVELLFSDRYWKSDVIDYGVVGIYVCIKNVPNDRTYSDTGVFGDYFGEADGSSSKWLVFLCLQSYFFK